MRLAELKKYNPITIQCHDNPDADTIASGFAMYRYFESLGKDVQLIYAGRNRIQKPNLLLMLEHLEIPITYVEDVRVFLEHYPEHTIPGLLLTVDCQYGAGNVTKLPAENVAVIDHHQVEIRDSKEVEINPHLGSCSTLMWSMLRQEGFAITDTKLGTALYYGLYTDTNQFAEIFNPLDIDMRESLPCEMSLITLFRNSNLSLQEMEIAGVAMIRHIYNNDYHYAIIKSQPCDPNILGLISDFLIQVAEVYCCVVYNEAVDGFKFSVRSCVKEVQANELAAFLAEGIGSGGGHKEKAGGFINERLYENVYPTLHTEAFFSERLNDYFDNCEIIYARNYQMDITGMQSYVEKRIPLGYVEASKLLPAGTPVTIRTLYGDVDMVAEESLIIMIGMKGEVYATRKEVFEKTYEVTGETYEDQVKAEGRRIKYRPTLHNRDSGEVFQLFDYARICLASGGTHIHAKKLEKRVKVFSKWDEEQYTLGNIGDYLAVRCEDRQDIFVVEKDIFNRTYEKIKHKN